jgi:hypothetical protein
VKGSGFLSSHTILYGFGRCVALCSLLSASLLAAASAPVVLNNVEVRISADASVPEQTAARVLVEEVQRRSGMQWHLQTGSSNKSASPGLLIVLATPQELRQVQLPGVRYGELGAQPPTLPESFRIRAMASEGRSILLIEGHDARGVLYGVGFVLRQLAMKPGSVSVSGALTSLETMQAPVYPVRGDQLGYRPKNNTFDGWSAAQFEQYIRDLAVFGTNTIELIPPRSDDVPSSPLFTLPPLEMMKTLSATLDRYGLDCSIWYPAMDKDYSDPATIHHAVEEWGAIFKALPRVDAVFVPGGDPGHTQPKYLFELLEQEAAELRRYHPHAQMWVSPQGFSAAWLQEFYDLLAQHPRWLTGVVYGPEMREPPDEFRRRVPSEYPIRFYPDITHTLSTQNPVPDWDPAFALTEGREPIDPEPMQQGVLFRRYIRDTTGFVAYSEGSNDDVNKILWSAWGWDPSQSSDHVLEEYARYFISSDHAGQIVQGIAGLEENWHGPLSTNPSIPRTLHLLERVEQETGGVAQTNWRMQQLLYRANYDAYLQLRAKREAKQQEDALDALRAAPESGADAALDRASALLAPAPDCKDSALCQRASSLAADLFRTVHMQLSVGRFGALAVDRGANLDRIDVPLNDRLWLLEKIAAARQQRSEQEKLRAIASMVAALDPPAGVLVDDLGLFGRHPHLAPGLAFKDDPLGFSRVYLSVVTAPPVTPEPLFARTFAGTLYDLPLTMHYAGLNRAIRYHLQIIYPDSAEGVQISANGSLLELRCLNPMACTEMDVDLPPSATATGDLTLEWSGPAGLGGNGRRLKVSRVVLNEAR